MQHLLHIHTNSARSITATTMAQANLMESADLERWIVDHPEVIDDSLKIVATQFNQWASEDGVTAKEALDILALAPSGQTVVIELKRGGERKVHLQAITYGALVAGFTRERLAEAHHEWLRKNGSMVSVEDALTALEDPLTEGWDDEILRSPRLVLVAEHIPHQVLTTIQWLTETLGGALEFECHEYQVFQEKESDNVETYASFRKLYPVDRLEGRTLRPAAARRAADVSDRIESRTRRARSVNIIAEAEGIPEGALLQLELGGLARPTVVDHVNAWLDQEPTRRSVTWTNDRLRPLRWAADEGDQAWSPTSLRDEIFRRSSAGGHPFSAADAWCYDGENLYSIANRLIEEQGGIQPD